MWCVLATAALGCVRPTDDLGDEGVASQQQAVETFAQATVDNAFAQASNSQNNLYAGKLTGQVNGRYVSWKTNPWSSSGTGQMSTCTYGWCGFFPIGNCSLSSGDSNAGYSYGACNSTAWGERFSGILWNNAIKAKYDTKVSGTTTFGYHPYWCFKYNGSMRTYQGWSYTNNCGSAPGIYYEVGSSTPPPATCGNGVVETGEACDLGAQNGATGSCCDKACQFMPATAVCRPSQSGCDKADTCTGTSATCPADAFENTGSTTCSVDSDCASLGDGYKCLALTSSTKKCWRTCRAAVGACDSTEYCGAERDQYGTWNAAAGPSCATDIVLAPGTSCTYNGASGTCSAGGTCDTPTLPSTWTCDDSLWGDGKCNCGCGAVDFECSSSSTNVYQACPGGQQCAWNQATCVPSSTPPGWGSGANTDGTCMTDTKNNTTGAAGADGVPDALNDKSCDVGCGGLDSDCDKLGMTLKEHCASGYSASWGEKTCHNGSTVPSGTPVYIYQQGLSSNFGKCSKSWASDGDCDIGCQFKDAKCGGPY
jgi:hypothetical protein